MTADLTAAVGWAGAAVLLLGYVQTSRGRWAGDGHLFQGCSILGSVGLAVAAAGGGVWSSAVLNVAWMAIGVTVVVRSRPRGRPSPGTVTMMRTQAAEELRS